MKRTVLIKRSQLLQQLRAFFYARSVTEVDTPMLSVAGVPDCHLHALTTLVQVSGNPEPQPYYLHTSPEYPMKRLLCQGSGDIFYLGKVFRQDALSPRHQVEFVMLEWYRLGFSMFELMAEVATLVQQVLSVNSSPILTVEQISYQQAFAQHANIENIFTATAVQCQQCLMAHGIAEIVGVDRNDKALWEQLVLTEVIEPHLGVQNEQPCLTFLYHYPASQAALAQVAANNPEVAERFELFVNGIELANGYHELADAQQYRLRFEASLRERKQLGYPPVPLDENLLLALKQQPLPDCSGVALGVDRLFALQQGLDNIEKGIAFGLRKA